MKLKKILHVAAFSLMLLAALPATAAEMVPLSRAMSQTEMKSDPRAQQLIQRLEEIRDMKRSEMSKQERKALRREVREIKKEMKEIKGGVYLSVGAIIVIILLLILIL
jgi:septal ring factor EnvC (AmiA/AmiB activator)